MKHLFPTQVVVLCLRNIHFQNHGGFGLQPKAAPGTRNAPKGAPKTTRGSQRDKECFTNSRSTAQADIMLVIETFLIGFRYISYRVWPKRLNYTSNHISMLLSTQATTATPEKQSRIASIVPDETGVLQRVVLVTPSVTT